MKRLFALIAVFGMLFLGSTGFVYSQGGTQEDTQTEMVESGAQTIDSTAAENRFFVMILKSSNSLNS